MSTHKKSQSVSEHHAHGNVHLSSLLPKGIGNAFAFSVFNTMSFNMVMGVPMMLYFKKLGASATILSIVAALVYVLNIFQIPAANFVEKIGYKKFVLRGWSARTWIIVFMVLVTVMPRWMDSTTRICLMLFLLFCYNMSRGISLCGFLPWITQMVPEGIRGRYISRDQMYISITNVFILAAVACFFEYFDQAWQFSFVFFFGFVVGMISLRFLKRMPDVPMPPSAKSRQTVPWGAMMKHKPFQKLLAYNFIVSSAISVSAVFYIPFLRDVHHASDSLILMFSVISGVIGIGTLFYFGKKIDHAGNHPFLVLGNALLVIHFLGWSCVAAKISPLTWGTILFLQITAGLGTSLFNMANTRMAMGIVPVMGRSHFFALFSVCNSLTMGLAPLLWGFAIDAAGAWNWQAGILNFNAYTILYIALALTMVGALISLNDLKDAPSMSAEKFMEELLIKSPVRAISRLWKRRPPCSPQI